jgi:hypothetical protein
MTSEMETCRIPTRQPAVPRWIVWSLRAAGICNIAWGSFVVFFPTALWSWCGMEPPNYPQLWQCIGMIVGVYGVGYWIAAGDIPRYWPVVLVGLLGKVLGPIGLVNAAARGQLPWAFGAVNIGNDLVWWIPFTAALYYAWRINSAPVAGLAPLPLDEAVRTFRSQHGRTLAELSAEQPLLVVFIRHVGCTFCREALSDVSSVRDRLDAQGVKLAVVHMSGPSTAEALLARYDLDDVDHFSDPDCKLFRAFELSRGAWWQLLGPRVWGRGLTAILRHGLGRIEGDGFQMPGVFLLKGGRIVSAFRRQTAADRPDYLQIAGAKG